MFNVYDSRLSVGGVYYDVCHDITQADLSDRCIEELQKIHLINENIKDLLPHLCQQQE